MPNFESSNFIYGIDPENALNKGMIKQIYALMDKDNVLTYHLGDELNDPINGWSEFDTVIMKLGILNPDIVKHVEVEFYTDTQGSIGFTNLTLDMFEGELGSVYLRLPESDYWDEFTVANNAQMTFTPIMYEESDMGGAYFTEGLPVLQMVLWEEENENYYGLGVDLEQKIFDIESSSVLVFNEEFTLLGEITDIDNRTEQRFIYDGSQGFDIEINNFTLPESFELDGNTIKLQDGDIVFVKYLAELPDSMGLTIEDIVLQRKPFLKNYDTLENDVPFAEISLLGLNNNGEEYDYSADLIENRDEMVAWNLPLDLTPFESDYFQTFHQKVINVSFIDIASAFKTVDLDGTEHCYITDVMITSNDPRYEIVVDSFFVFEFDENNTLYDSEFYDIHVHNNLEKIHVGEISDVYEDVLVFDISDNKPLYHDNAEFDETDYFEIFDNLGNYYYTGSQILATIQSAGVYEFEWNEEYEPEYHARYNDWETDDEWDYLQELYEYYHPHIDDYRYLYVSYANDTAWSEWRTIDAPNLNLSSIGITFEWYDDLLEEYDSIIYNASESEFESRQVAVEYLYPFEVDSNNGEFNLSQSYAIAKNLDIISIKGYYYNETFDVFDPQSCYLIYDDASIEITGPSTLSDYEYIVILYEFTSGAYSDYSQFRMKQDAIDNHLDIPEWTTNDTFYVDFEYFDLDYFLLMEDYAVGDENSMFEFLNYTRNDGLYEEINGVLEVSKEIYELDCSSFEGVNITTSTLIMRDADFDGEHEYIVEKHDLTADGLYDTLKYARIDPNGEITFHTMIQDIEVETITTDKSGEYLFTVPYEIQLGWNCVFQQFGQKFLITNTTLITTQYTKLMVVQEDLDGDGSVDKEISFESQITSIKSTTYTLEITNIGDSIYELLLGKCSESHKSYTKSEFTESYSSSSFTFRDFEDEEVVSTRVYKDAFANELVDMCGLDNFLMTVTDDLGDDDPENDIITQVPSFDSLFDLNHARDEVPMEFDQAYIIENGEMVVENILTSTETLIIPKTSSDKSDVVLTDLEIIKVTPTEGVYYANDVGGLPDKVEGGSYGFISSNNDGTFETILVFDGDNNIIGIAFDYDADHQLLPDKRIHVSREDIGSETVSRDELGLATSTFEPTFSDALFDIWKMTMKDERSVLIQEAEQLSTDQFWQDPGALALQFIGDVLVQVLAFAAGFLGASLTGGNPLGFAGGYMLVTLPSQLLKQHQAQQYIYSQTFLTTESKGEVVLTDQWWYDEYMGGSIPDTIVGNLAGVYTKVQKQSDVYSYEGDLILAKNNFGEFKTGLGTYADTDIDLALSTRNLAGFGDYGTAIGGLYVDAFLSYHLCVGYNTDPEYMHSKNSMIYIMNEAAKASNQGDTETFDSIMPTMAPVDDFGMMVPMMEFAGSLSGLPLPSFYENYPLFTEEHDDSTYKVYKVSIMEDNQFTILDNQLLEPIQNDLEGVTVYIALFDYHFGDVCEEIYAEYHLKPEDYNYTKADGILEFSEETFEDIQGKFDEYMDECFYERYDVPKVIVECEFEKYRTISDITDMDEEEINSIVSMQSIQETLLTYYYQFSMATEMQNSIWEIAYTIGVVAVSTALSMGLSTVFGKVAKSVVQSSAISGQALNFPKMLSTMMQSSSVTGIKIVGAIVSETGQELLMDPWIEGMVTGITADMGLPSWAQMLASTLAESMREAIGGPISWLSGSKSNTPSMISEMQTLMRTKQDITGADILGKWMEVQAQAQMQAEEESTISKLSGLILSTLGAIALISSGFGMFATPLMSSMISSSVNIILESGGSLKQDLFKNLVENKETQQSQGNWFKIAMGPITSLTSESFREFLALKSAEHIKILELTVRKSNYLDNPTYLRSVRLFDMIKAIIKSKIGNTQGMISQNLGLHKNRLGDYRAAAKNKIVRFSTGEYYIKADTLDSMEFNILNNPFFSDLNEWQKDSIVKLIDNYRNWVVSFNTKRPSLNWRYRVHRSGYSDLDIAIKKKMWLFRELKAAYTQIGEKIITDNNLVIELFGQPGKAGKAISNRFYLREKAGNKDISIQTYLMALSSVMMSRTIKDRNRALNALYDYGKTVFNFDLKNPNHRLIIILMCAFRSEPTISGVFNQDLLSLTRITNMIADIIQPETFAYATLTNKIWNDFLFTEPSIDKIKLAIEKLISDSDIKSYTLAYLDHYKEKYAIIGGYSDDRNFLLNKDFKSTLKSKALIDYLSIIRGSVKNLPATLLSQEDKDSGIRISSFNQKLTYVMPEIKTKFISKMLRSTIKAFAPGQAPTDLSFINDLMDFSRNKLYDKKYLLTHGSPAHEAILPSLVENMDWAVACEVPIFLKFQKLAALLGHLDLLVYKDGVYYVCDYKPDQLSRTKTNPYLSFINSVPQISSYALVLKLMFNLKEVKCVTFNKKGAWVYDPVEALTEITDFMNKNKESSDLPWEPYLKYLT